MKGVKLAYFRDLSELINSDNRRIKKHLLFRSSHLGKIKNKSLMLLRDKYNIKTILDLRGFQEVKDVPDRFIEGQEYYHFPILSDKENPSVNRKTRSKVLKERMHYPGGAKAFLKFTYKGIVCGEQAISYYKKIFELLLTKDGSFIFHCSQGKDRTGMLTALILFALGFDKEKIKKDYLKYNKHRFLRNFFIRLAVSVLLLSPRKARQLNYLLTSKREYFDSAYEAIVENYGSVESYLEKAIGLTSQNIADLKTKFLAN